MNSAAEQVLLRIYLQTADRAPHTPTYQRIVKLARARKLAGATVLKGVLGAGYHDIIKPRALAIVEHAPVIVEIVDVADAIANFCREIFETPMIGGIATLERAAVMMRRSGAAWISLSHSLPIEPEVTPPLTIPNLERSPHMTVNTNGILLRIFVGDSDRHEHQPLHEQIVRKVRELGLAGATVLRGVEGFGAHSVVHKSSLLEMSSDLPIVIEIVDTQDKIKQLLPHLESMVTEGMVTMEDVTILMYRHGGDTMPKV
jgi:PII-like signaling protein